MIYRAIAVLFVLACAANCVREVVLEPNPDAGSGAFNTPPDAPIGDGYSDDGGGFPDGGIIFDAAPAD